MRHLSSAALRAGLIAVVIGLPVPASAQSFLQNLFGWGTSSAPPDRTVARPGAPASVIPLRPDASWNREIRRYSPSASEDRLNVGREDNGQSQSQPGSGSYRTLCVRTCDGYYFPIGNAVSRHRFMRDAAQCRASCGEEARLFYLPAGSDNVATMLDLAGRSYVRMATAFKYRKSLTDGCSCRPMPWSAAEQQRHQGYAEEAARVAAETETRRLAAEAAEAERSAARTRIADKLKAGIPTEGGSRAAPGTADGKVAVVTSTANAAAEDAPNSEAFAAVATSASEARPTTPDIAAGLPPSRVDRNRQPSTARSADRIPPARRQLAAVRAPAPQGSSSWFTPSSSKYTWPGDPPRR